MKRILFATVTIAAALIFAGRLTIRAACAAEPPAAQLSPAPAAQASGAPQYPMMRWHERMHGPMPPMGPGGPMPMGPGGPMACCPCMTGGPGMGMMSSDPKLRAQMMQLQGEMMKKMGELMEQRAKELGSGK